MEIIINENDKVIHKGLRGRPSKYNTDEERKKQLKIQNKIHAQQKMVL